MASSILVNSIKAQSGTDVNVPTGFKLKVADVGELYIGGVQITTGAHATAVSAVNPLTITSGNVTGKSNYTVSYNASSGTSTAMVVNLPTPANFQTTVISVVSSTTHGAGNSIVIKNSAGTEVYTLYHKGDHCEFVSDGTNTLRTGNEWVTIRGETAATDNVNVAGNSSGDIWNSLDAANYDVTENIGAMWNTTTDDLIAPHAGEYRVRGSIMHNAYPQAWLFQKNGAWMNQGTTHDTYGNGPVGDFPIVLAAADVLTIWASSTSGGACTFYGAAAATSARTTVNWWCQRRY